MKNLTLFLLLCITVVTSSAQGNQSNLTVTTNYLQDDSKTFSDGTAKLSAKIVNTENGTLTIQIDNATTEPITYQFLSAKGSLLEHGKIRGAAGSQLFSKNTETWPTGVYQVVLSSGVASKTLRFINR
jgi:hypothetical protein